VKHYVSRNSRSEFYAVLYKPVQPVGRELAVIPTGEGEESWEAEWERQIGRGRGREAEWERQSRRGRVGEA
jgi:hypothetical protein